MTTTVWTNRLSSRATSIEDAALPTAARLWYLTAVAGQLVFAFAVASFYTSAVVRGNLAALNRFMPQAHVPGDTVGNVTSRLFSQSSNAYDSLGEAYLAAGDRAQAVANYRIALQLDPARQSAAEALQKLGVPTERLFSK
jgi:tetratricopeptide (TPR) repeat protein